MIHALSLRRELLSHRRRLLFLSLDFPHVPDTFQLGAISAFFDFRAGRFFNNLRLFNIPEYSDSPRLQNFAKRNFVLSEPRFQGESKGKIAMFYAYIRRRSDDTDYVDILTQCASGTSGPCTGCSLSFRRPRRWLQQRHPLRTLRGISRTHQDSKN